MTTGMIILLCRNALHYSRKCLPTLLAQTSPVKVMVVNNASTDGTSTYMRSQEARNPNVSVISYEQVQSVAHCWNEALRWAWAFGHEEALVVNSDTELLPDTYGLLASWLRLKSHGMLTAVGVDENPGYPSKTMLERPHPDYSCFMISKWAHLRVPFDEGYEGAYFEDADHHVRMYRAGIYAGSIDLGFLHHSSGTLKSAGGAETARINNCYRRNKARFLATYGTVPGTKGYEALFLPALLDGGSERSPAQDAK